MPGLNAERRYYQRHRERLASRAKWRQRLARDEAKLQAIDRYLALALTQLRWWPPALREVLQQEDYLWRDVQQTCYLAALAAHKSGLSVQETSRLAQRELYALLKAHGWRRQKGTQRWLSDLEIATPEDLAHPQAFVAGRN